MQYGMPRAWHREGSHITISTGSTSWAITTSLASFSSTSLVTWLIPILTHTGFLESTDFAGSLSLGSLADALGLLALALRLELVEQPEELARLALVEGVLELVDCWRHLDTLVQDPARALDPHVLGPLDEAGEVSRGADVATDGEGPRLLLDHVGREFDLGRSLLRHFLHHSAASLSPC